jgi:LysR family transcriptional regulator, transcriptional activator of nhaA
LLMSFGQAGAGLFAAPSALADYVCQQYAVQALGRVDAVVEQIFAITTERRLTNPAIVAVVKATRWEVFGRPGA